MSGPEFLSINPDAYSAAEGKEDHDKDRREFLKSLGKRILVLATGSYVLQQERPDYQKIENKAHEARLKELQARLLGELEKAIEYINTIYKKKSFSEKIEFMTGYRLKLVENLDASSVQSRVLRFDPEDPVTEEDFNKNNFKNGRTFWSEWSRYPKTGKILLNAEYYNDMLDGKDVSFSEENGKIIRTIK